MSRRIIALVVILVLVIAAGVVFAQGARRYGRSKSPAAAKRAAGKMAGEPCWGRGMGFGPEMWQKIGQQLNLTPQQQTQIKTIHQQFLDNTMDTRREIQSRMLEMKQLWMAEPPNAQAIKNLAAEIDPLRAQLRDAAIDSAVAAMLVLTPDQRAKLRSMISSHSGFGAGLGSSMFGGMGMCPGKQRGTGAGRGAGPSGCCSMAQ